MVIRKNWMKVVKRYKFPVIRYVSTGNVINNMVTMYEIFESNRINPESSHHKEKQLGVLGGDGC